MPDTTSFAVLGLGPATGNWYMRVARYADEQATLATARHDAGPRARGNAGALRDLAQKLYQMRFNVEDPLAILGTHVFLATGRTDPSQPYVPSESASLVLHRVGQEGNIAWTDVLVAVLAAEIKDLAKTINRRTGELRAAQQAAEEASAARTAVEQTLNTERGGRLAAEAEVARLRAELDQARAENDYLSSALGNGGEDVERVESTVASGDFPSADQLEAALERRVKVGEGLYVQRHDSDTFYAGRWSSGGQDRFAWLGSATNGQMTLSDAAAARRRLMNAAREEVS